MEQSPNNYRDGLAKDLKELRNRGVEGKKDAEDFLSLAKKTSRYEVAKDEHLKARDVKTSVSLENKQEALSPVEQSYKIILQDPRIHVLINGTGNILNKNGAPTKGQLSAWWNKDTQSLIALNDSQVDLCLDSLDPKMSSKYFLRESTLKGGQVLILDVAVRGLPGNKFLEDNRNGCHLTCAIHFTDQAQIRDVLGKELSDIMFSGEQLLTQKTGELLHLFLKRLVPDYYENVVVG